MLSHLHCSPRGRVAAFGLLVGLAAIPVLARPGQMPIARRTAGLLASDLNLDKVYLVRDLNNNGSAADAGEVTVFFDGTNASGLPSPTGAVFSMFQSDDGTVYLGDGDTDTVYAVKDSNNDGDVLDVGEARVWFSSFNALLLPLPTPNGITQGANGTIYISNAGVTASPQDGIYATRDMNNDGNANGVGEQSIFVDETALMVPSAAPFECAAIGNDIYFLDPRGSSPDAILVGKDPDNSGTVDATELSAFYLAGGAIVLAPVSFTCQTDGTSIFVHESATSATQTIWRLTDTDASGSIDMAAEGVSIWSETSLPGGSAMANSFSFSFGPGKVAISSNGADAVDEIIVASDTDNNGDYNDAGGTTILIQGTAAVSFPENIRLLMYYGSPCRADINNSGTVTVQDIFDFLAFYFSSDLRADINGSGTVTVQDIFDYLALYFIGC